MPNGDVLCLRLTVTGTTGAVPLDHVNTEGIFSIQKCVGCIDYGKCYAHCTKRSESQNAGNQFSRKQRDRIATPFATRPSEIAYRNLAKNAR